MDRLLRPGSSKLRVVDAAGHIRPPYPGLLVYAWRRALAVASRDLPGEESRARFTGAVRLVQTAGRIGRAHAAHVRRRQPAPADTAAALSDSAWAAVASRGSACAPLGFSRDLRRATGERGLLPAGPSANPEPLWYHELVLLHAVTAYAVNWNDAAAREAAVPQRRVPPQRNPARPRHERAVGPAGVHPEPQHAFARRPAPAHRPRPPPRRREGVTAILLADVLDHLRELARRPG